MEKNHQRQGDGRGKRKIGRYKTFRLLPADKQAIQKLGKRGRKQIARHEALVELVEELENMELPNAPNEKHVPMRIGIPAELDKTNRGAQSGNREQLRFHSPGRSPLQAWQGLSRSQSV